MRSNFNLPFIVRRKPQSRVSVTEPGQAPSLRYIIGALKRGETLNIRQAMVYDNNPSLDDIDVRNLDSKHLLSSDLDVLLSHYKQPSETPVGPSETPVGPSETPES